MKLISVIIPIYNVEQYLRRCVDSILNQTYKKLEVILVDDGSPDKCPQICDEYESSDPRVKVIHKENAGQGLARNDALEIATGDYVTFVDADDYIDNTHIENLYTALTENNAQAVIGTHTAVNHDGQTKQIPLLFKEGVYEGQQITDEIVLPLIGADAFYPSDVMVDSSTCMNLYSMDIIRENKLRFISERYAVAEDQYFNIDYFHYAKRIVAVNEYGYYYFENIASTSRKYNEKRFERTLNYYHTINEQVKRYGLQDRVAHRADRSFLMKVRVNIRLIVLSDLKFKDKVREIRFILNNDVVATCLNNYPINSYIPSMRLLMKMMRSKNVFAIFVLMYVREGAKQSSFFVGLLKSIGIGR